MVAAPRRSAGFTYLTILFVIAFMGAGLALAGGVWHTSVLREKETELLHIGNEYRKAIERYYLSGPKQYPRSLEDLLRDPRQPGIVRHLRRLYPDPVSNGADWVLVKAPDGGVAGVHSVSGDAPLKTADFPLLYREFAAARSYADWRFLFVPLVQSATSPDARTSPR